MLGLLCLLLLVLLLPRLLVVLLSLLRVVRVMVPTSPRVHATTTMTRVVGYFGMLSLDVSRPIQLLSEQRLITP